MNSPLAVTWRDWNSRNLSVRNVLGEGQSLAQNIVLSTMIHFLLRTVRMQRPCHIMMTISAICLCHSLCIERTGGMPEAGRDRSAATLHEVKRLKRVLSFFL